MSLNQGSIGTQIINIDESQKAQLIYSDPLPNCLHFQGRRAELTHLEDWLADPSISVIGVRGEGGIGKSTLMAKAFEDCKGFAGKFWVDVRTGTSITVLASRALQELGVPPDQVRATEEKDLVRSLLRHLQMGRYLIAIDNLESVLTAMGEWRSGYELFVEGFQDLGSESVLLLASREYPAKYFGWIRSQWLMVEQGLEPLEGAALLKALEVEDTEEKRAEVSVQVQGNPLALSLIAGWINAEYRPGERLVESLKQHTDLFQLEGEHRKKKDVSVEHVLQWSLNRLNPIQKDLLTQTSVFRGAFNAEAATAVVTESKFGRAVCDTDLDDLERRSLLQILPERDKYGLRVYRLQPRIRELIQKEAKDLLRAHERTISYFWRLRQTQFSKNDTQEAVAEYEEVFYHQRQLGLYAQALKTILRCNKFLHLRGYYQTLLNLYGQLCNDWPANQRECRDYADVCNAIGETYRTIGEYQRAIDFYRQSIDIERQIDDRGGEVAALNNLGLAYKSLGRYEEAINYYEQSLKLANDINDLRGQAYSLGSLGNVYHLQGQYEKARDYHQRSLEIKRTIRDDKGEANSLSSIGYIYYSLGQYDRAIDFHQQSLEIKRDKLGNRLGEANSLIGLGTAYLGLGAAHPEVGHYYQEAIDFYQKALEITRTIHTPPSEAKALGGLGDVHGLLGHAQQAIDFHQQALKIQREIIHDPQGEANSLSGLGSAYFSSGNYSQAKDFYRQALKIQREIPDRNGEANSLLNMGHVLARIDEHYEALQNYQQAMAIYEELKLDHIIEQCKKAIAERNKIIAMQRRTAPSIGESKPSQNDWWEKSLPTPAQTSPSRPARLPLARWQQWGLWFLVGVAIVLVIWWLW